MSKLLKIIIISILATAIFSGIFAPAEKAMAQITSIGIATYIPINNAKVEDGDIIIATPGGYALSSAAYDSQLVGVVSKHSAVELNTFDQGKSYPVVNTGTVYVRVTGEKGNIKKGDFIATSSTPGTGMKVTNNGFVLGEALQGVSFEKPKDVKMVLITLNLHYLQVGSPVSSSLLDIFNLSKVATFEKPSRVLQYVVAAIITIASFACGFLIFGKAVNTGLEALGRNPLAGRMIQLSIVLNLLLIALVIAAGTALAYLVIRL